MAGRALITGVTGQDGSYLAQFLLDKGYEVYGLVRRLSSPNLSRISHIADSITILEGDLTDQSSLGMALQVAQPDEVYNLASQSFVATSWTQPTLTGDVTGLGAARLLEAVRQFSKHARVFQASSSEMFGNADESPQDENTRFCPRSPYACSKVYAHNMAVNYRESYGMFICCGISFNHESPRRGLEFVTRKITDSVSRIYYGLAKNVRLGNIDARRDWGFAQDYVEAMWLMLQQGEPDDYVVATGDTHSVRDFVRLAFEQVGLDWNEYVVVDQKLMRPADVTELRGNASKAARKLGWTSKVTFEQLVNMMVQADLEKYKPSAMSR